MEILPLNVQVRKGVINGKMFDVVEYEEYVNESENSNLAVRKIYKDKEILLPVKGEYEDQSTPGIYNAGCIDFIVYPSDDEIDNYVPSKIIDMSNNTPIKEMLEKKDIIAKLDEPWITSPDNITQFNILNEDKAEMRCLKTALNKKHIDFDKYASRFGDNFPNDKRQLKNNSATLNIIKRFCEKMDMEAILILRDKKSDVPNPMGSEVVVSLTEEYPDEED